MASGENKAEKIESAPGFFAVVWEYVWTLGLMALIVFSARSSLADWYEVPSGSMLPTILEGDRIFVNKLAYNFRVPFTTQEVAKLGDLSRGDIVVFLYPVDQKTDYIKRLVGLPGDTIEVKNNLLYINGKVQSRRPISPEDLPPDVKLGLGQQAFIENLDGVEHYVYESANRNDSFGPFKVLEGTFFAMGDNRDNSSDSRFWGAVPYELLKGRALRVVLSIDPVSECPFLAPSSDCSILNPRRIVDPKRLRTDRSVMDLYNEF